MRKPLVLALLCGGILATTACTPREVRQWVAWHDDDPAAAEEFANSPEVQASLHGDQQDSSDDEAPASSGRGGCDGIYDALRSAGASSDVAHRLAYTIAPRESGCSPQFVHDRDDWSYSRFGLNAGAHGENVGAWQRLCGADVRSDTKNLSTDVRCALAAHAAMGWRPWSY